MAITIRVDGVAYTNFLAVSIDSQLDAVCNSFSIDVATSNKEPLPFKGGEECELYVNEQKILTGFIEVCIGSYDSKSHDITYQGRDKTCDLLDSSIDNLSDLAAPISLKGVCEKVISNINLDLKVTNGTETADFNKAEDLIAPERGDNAFSFLQELASKRQVLISSDEDGQLLLTQNEASLMDAKLQNLIGADDNNVISASWNYDTTQRYNLYVCAAQLNPSALNFSGKVDLVAVAGTSARVSDNQVREGRQYAFKPDKSSSESQDLDRAKWELNMRKARGLSYTAVVNGHTIGTDSDQIWKTNTLVQVSDDFAGINARMLVNKVTFLTDLTNGNQTEIELVHKDSYTLAVEDPANTSDEIAVNLFELIGVNEES